MKNSNLFYQESLKINPMGLALSYTVCLLLALVLGYLYSSITIIIPIIYVNFLITIGFGLTLGIINRLLVRLTHNRNKKSQIIQALISGVAANYFQWTAYILYAFYGEVPSFSEYLANLHWIIIPENFFEAIIEINKVGLWSIFGISFNGFGLTIVWLLEVFIITALPMVAVYKTNVYPYSEILGKWYPKYTLFKDFESISTVNQLLNDLQEDALSAINKLGKGGGTRHSKIHLFYHKDENWQYLTFEKIFVEGQGKGKKNSDILINNFSIDRNTAQSILEAFDHKRSRIDVI